MKDVKSNCCSITKSPFPRLLLCWERIQLLFQRKSETISSTGKQVLTIFLTTVVPNAFPVRNPMSARNAMPSGSIPYAGVAPCAIPCVKILKRKPANIS